MKKSCNVAAIILFVAIFLCSCAAFNPNFEINAHISGVLDLDVTSGTEIYRYDSHGGFHGDGVLCYDLKFPDDTVAKEIEKHPHWHPLPLKDDMKKLLYAMKDEQEKTLLPDISNGYYFFYDRHSESNDPYDDTDVMNRHSFNMTAAIYDTENHTLYYIEFDT